MKSSTYETAPCKTKPLDLPAYALKRLLNHKMNNDVTAGYIMKDVERLRKPMEYIAKFMLENMTAEET